MFSPGCVLEWEVIKKDYSSYPIWSVIALKLEFDIKSKRNTKDYFSVYVQVILNSCPVERDYLDFS